MTTCTVLTQRLHNLHQEDPANLAEMAAHIRACARCRRGQIALPPGLETIPKRGQTERLVA
jgi:hypothetical protein